MHLKNKILVSHIFVAQLIPVIIFRIVRFEHILARCGHNPNHIQSLMATNIVFLREIPFRGLLCVVNMWKDRIIIFY